MVMDWSLIGLLATVIVISTVGLFLASRPVTPSRRTEQLERIARSLESLEHAKEISADEWRAVLYETRPNAEASNPADMPPTSDAASLWVDEHRQAVVEKLDANPARNPAPARAVTEYPVGRTVWIHGIAEGSLHPGVIVHRFKLTQSDDPRVWEYVIRYQTPIGDLLALRAWFGLSETPEGPINRWRGGDAE